MQTSNSRRSITPNPRAAPVSRRQLNTLLHGRRQLPAASLVLVVLTRRFTMLRGWKRGASERRQNRNRTGAYGEKKRHFAEESAFHDARAAFMDGRFRGDGSLIKTNRASPTYAGDARGGIFPGGRGNVRPEGMGVGVTLLCRAGASVLPRSRLSRRDRFPLCAGDPGARGPSRRPSRQAPRRHAREPAVPHHERP